VQEVVLKRPEVRIEHEVSIANDRQAMNGDVAPANLVECFGEDFRVHPLRLGRGTAPALRRPLGLLRCRAHAGSRTRKHGQGDNDGDPVKDLHVLHSLVLQADGQRLPGSALLQRRMPSR
jgi:hypothetical protein